MFSCLAALSLASTLAFPVLQDKGIQSFSGTNPRSEVAMGVYDPSGGGFKILGFMTLSHGLPVWNKDYDAKIDEAKGHTWRFGKDGWTTLDTNVPLTIGGKDVPAGLFYLGIGCSKDDKWTLVFVDPAKAKEKGAVPFMMDDAPVAFTAPLTYAKDADKPTTEKLWVGIKADEKAKNKGTLEIRWGNHYLSAPLEMNIGGAKDASTPKGKEAPPKSGKDAPAAPKK